MSLEEKVAELVAATNRLTEGVMGKTAQIDARVAAAEQQVKEYIAQGGANFPVTPNLLRDTKKFTGLCQGKLNTPMAWNEGGMGGYWSGFFHEGAVGTATIEVVNLADRASAEERGLRPYAELAQLVREDGHGVDVHAVILDVSVTDMGTGGGFYLLCQGCSRATAWSVGRWQTQVSLFASVLAYSGNINAILFANRGAGVGIGGDAVGKGWKHYHNTKSGFGGCEQTRFHGVGSMKLALALPYEGHGNHGGIPIWAGFAGHYQSNDTV